MSQPHLTPAQAGFLIHCHVNPEPHPYFDSPVIQGAIKFFGEEDCIVARDRKNSFTTTPKGAAWIQAICSVPPPKTAYIGQNGEILLVQP